MNNNVNRFTSSAGGQSLTEYFTFGKDNLPETYTYPTGVKTTYTHEALNRRKATVVNTPTPINTNYIYLLSERNQNGTENFRTTKIGWEHINDIIYQYKYDKMGNITEVAKRNKITEPSYIPQQRFAYDELNQLIRADDLAKNCTEVYTYGRKACAVSDR